MDKESLIDECTQQKGCIKSLKITAHGHGSLAHAVLYTSKEEIWENIDKEEISDMLGSFVFCKKCYIELIACNIGKYELLKERIIKKTGCTVKLYDFKVPALVEVYRWFGNTDEEIKKFSEDISK